MPQNLLTRVEEGRSAGPGEAVLVLGVSGTDPVGGFWGVAAAVRGREERIKQVNGEEKELGGKLSKE